MSSIRGARLGRRQVLVDGGDGRAAVGVGAGFGRVRGGCSAAGAAGPGGQAKQGGILRLGAQGGANTDTLDGQNGLKPTPIQSDLPVV